MSESLETAKVESSGWRQLAGTACLLAVVALEIDQISKLWIRGTLALGESIPSEGSIRLTHAANPGVAFGIPASPPVSLIVPLAAVVACLVIYWRFQRSNSMLLNIGIAVFIGGTLGNMVDRVLYGHVTDFIEMAILEGSCIVVFNVADLCVITGFVILEVFLMCTVVRMVRKNRLGHIPETAYIARRIGWRGTHAARATVDTRLEN